MTGVKLRDADFRNAELQFAQIINTSLGNANLSGAKNISTINFEGTTVHNLVLEDGTVIEFCDHDW